MMRQKKSIGDKEMPDPRWESLTSSWFSEFGICVDLHTAASIGDMEGVKHWISNGADLNALNRGGWTPLMYASYLSHEDVCTLLLLFNDSSNRLSVDMPSRDRRQTALMLASSCGNENTVALLLKNGASLNAVDDRNRSALHYATECNHAHVVRQLLLAGADPNLPGPPDGQEGYLTPFQMACSEGLDMIVQYFLHCGAADSNTVAESVRALASKNGHTKIVSMIDNYRSAGNGKRSKFDDKLQFSKSHSLLDGPNAISSLMKLQSRLTPSDSQLYQKCHKRPPISKERQQMDDYEKTMTVDQIDQSTRPKTIDELLDLLQLTKYLSIFQEHNVDLEKLLTLNGDQLKDMGIKLFGPRKKILNAIERWHQNLPLTGIL